MITIAVGTTSRYKLNAIKKSLYELDFEFEAVGVDVDSGISEQPMAENETKKGSINRAQNALKNLEKADFGLGVEFGYEPDHDSYKMICWASIVTVEGLVISEHSSSLELPKKLRQILENGEDVSDNLDTIFEDLRDKERNRIFKRYLKKRIFIYESVAAVCIRYLLNKEAY